MINADLSLHYNLQMMLFFTRLTEIFSLFIYTAKEADLIGIKDRVKMRFLTKLQQNQFVKSPFHRQYPLYCRYWCHMGVIHFAAAPRPSG